MKTVASLVAVLLLSASPALALDFTNDSKKSVNARAEPNDGSASTETVSAGATMNFCDNCSTCKVTVKKQTVEAACDGKVTWDGSKLKAE